MSRKNINVTQKGHDAMAGRIPQAFRCFPVLVFPRETGEGLPPGKTKSSENCLEICTHPGGFLGSRLQVSGNTEHVLEWRLAGRLLARLMEDFIEWCQPRLLDSQCCCLRFFCCFQHRHSLILPTLWSRNCRGE